MPSAPHPDRLARLRASLATSQLDALLVSALPNIRYLSGFTGSNALMVVTSDDAVLLTDFRYEVQVKDEVSPAVRVVIEQQSLWTRLWKELKTLAGVEVLAFETAHTTHQDAARFVAEGGEGSRWRWRPALNLVEVLRETKDESELAQIRAAVQMAEHALSRTLPQVGAGLSELEVAGLLEFEMRKAGSERTAFETIVAAGARSALPHARASAQLIEKGDLLLFDFGATSGGYVSDITRTYIVGQAPDERQQEIHGVVREANGSASAGVRAGMRGRDADALARDYIERRGFGAAFGHSTGHGIGLEIHEAPRVAKTAEAPLPAGSVVTIEPGIYVEGWGGVRIEDDVLISSEGPVVLTGFERGLIQL
ncbi:MAG: aminopeptidase P family protein [Gemmatimonadaceae bacterium]|nr:aminopeptidase P family protein [Gemmatimonadaceae bacterium]MCW5825436.1 aminopeptidase P family protein [Gemmatimonadaceae bacterium]